ncbi:rhodanese-like domain-containing protein [Zavarzinia sp. CC-PAN008]|uniref:rhodanese-like domain-containing protein n=1 Tax=Zavarzinia sp. CC-PAN008 TaxID=3243332 RepID=UPI003F743CAB
MYAGDISVKDAWGLLSDDSRAVLVDVRTDAEWAYVGLPDLSALGKPVVRLSWQVFPSMAVDPQFTQRLHEMGMPHDAPILFLCRSGVRSRAAAIAATQAGFTRAHNVAGGFEGDLDGARQRGHVSGWKAAGLPWIQS